MLAPFNTLCNQLPNHLAAGLAQLLEPALVEIGQLRVVQSQQVQDRNVQIFERNFDIFNVPRSFSDIFNGNAFRGGGQSLQISLQAGNLINMMSVSLREPYLFDLPIGASGTGFLMSRVYPTWDERRGGGQFSLGRQIGTSIYADVSTRAEEVDLWCHAVFANL